MKAVVDVSWTWNFSKRWELGGRKISILCSPGYINQIMQVKVYEHSRTCCTHSHAQIMHVYTYTAHTHSNTCTDMYLLLYQLFHPEGPLDGSVVWSMSDPSPCFQYQDALLTKSHVCHCLMSCYTRQTYSMNQTLCLQQ